MKESKGTVFVSGNGREFKIIDHPILIKKYLDLGYSVVRKVNGREVYC